MYRDEVEKVIEGAVDAYRRGEAEAKRDVGPYVLELEQAVRTMAPVMKRLSETQIAPLSSDATTEAEALHSLCSTMVRQIKEAWRASRAEYLRTPRRVWDEGIPF